MTLQVYASSPWFCETHTHVVSKNNAQDEQYNSWKREGRVLWCDAMRSLGKLSLYDTWTVLLSLAFWMKVEITQETS